MAFPHHPPPSNQTNEVLAYAAAVNPWRKGKAEMQILGFAQVQGRGRGREETGERRKEKAKRKTTRVGKHCDWVAFPRSALSC